VALDALIPEQYRAPGLSASELAAAQERAGVPFPPDLCELLTATLPTGEGFPDWRKRPKKSLEAFRQEIIEGIEFDAIHNAVWVASWGEPPTNRGDLRELIMEKVREAPALIPIWGHRAIPNEPLEAGNPVYSIVQTDIIVYGHDLADYLRREFDQRAVESPPGAARTIRFWTDLLDANDG
jgi:hypothetical protein